MIATAPWNVTRIEEANTDLGKESPQAILQWSIATFGNRLSMATAFGAEGCCLIHMIAEIDPSMNIFNLETGYQFAKHCNFERRSRTGTELLSSISGPN